MAAMSYLTPGPLPAPAGPPRRVLVVEDDAGLLGTLELLLAHYGYEPLLAPTLADARRHLAAVDPDVVVLDLQLPDGNGVDLLEHLRATGRRARVLVLSGGTSPEHVSRLRHLRPDRTFRKPMNFLDLLQAVRAEVADAHHGVAAAVPLAAAA